VSEEWAAGARAFCNKLWNATRFALLNGAVVGELPPSSKLSAPDRWILSRLQATLAEADRRYEQFELARACEVLYRFTWDEFCDWYLELAKGPLTRGGVEAERTRLVLGHVLDVVLRLLHPVVPYVTETLWTTLTGKESVVIAPWPTLDEGRPDPAAESDLNEIMRLVTEVRRFRSEQGIKPGRKVAARLNGIEGSAAAPHEAEIRSLARLEVPGPEFQPGARLPVGGVVVEIDLAGAVDYAAERRRLEKDLTVVRKELEQVTAKLDNDQFVARAPGEVVEQMRVRQDRAKGDISRLLAQLEELPS
jgi:valyl-tRNA synthetase